MGVNDNTKQIFDNKMYPRFILVFSQEVLHTHARV